MTKRRKMSTRQRWRVATRWAVVLLAFALGLRHLWMAEAPAFDHACPFGGLETLARRLTTGTYLRTTDGLNLLLLGLLVAAALLTGRAFCGWFCPLGALQDGIAWLVARLTRQKRGSLFPLRTLPAWMDRPLRLLKYLILALILWNSLSAVVPPLQPFCPYRTLFALNLHALLNWSVLLGFLLLSLVVERFWCRYLCPLGAFLALFNAVAPWRLRLKEGECVHCKLCEKDCPMGLVPHRISSRDGECIRCLACTDGCPRHALTPALSLTTSRPEGDEA